MKIMGMILAGGEGKRLFPLTAERAKPAVPFGGKYRIIDFVLSNFINSGIYSIFVLTQFKSQSLTEHIQEGFQFGTLLPNHFILPVPAQMRTGDSWYRGTADAIHQNINLIEDRDYDLVCVFGADHIYKMDIRQMVSFHNDNQAKITVSAIPVPLDQATEFGVIQVDEKGRIIGFQEKPKDPIPIPGRPGMAYASMGNYIFDKEFLVRVLHEDAKRPNSSHDFGKDILPRLYKTYPLYAYDFAQNRVPGITEEEVGYWRDVGTIQSFWEANMDLRNVKPIFNLYNRKWPIKTVSLGLPPAKFVFNQDGRRGQAVNSLVSEGSIISGGIVQDSTLGRGVFVDTGSAVINSLIMDRVVIHPGCKINLAIIDKDVVVPPNTIIGYNLEEDKKRFYVDESSNIIVISKGQKIE